MKNKILISKEILRIDYLSCYGGELWSTPNIDDLATKGTVFRRHYASSPSTAMSISSMFTGKYPYQLNRKTYKKVDHFTQNKTLFEMFNDRGYKTCVIWPFDWIEKAYNYSKVFSTATQLYNLKNIKSLASNSKEVKKENYDENHSAVKTLNRIVSKVNKFLQNEDPVFIWIHLPHVLYGRTGYGSDIDLFDKLVGTIRKMFDDDSIYITADHGHMNCENGIPVYGFHLKEGAIRIPFITPKINGKDEILFPTSNAQLIDIILHDQLTNNRFIYSDTMYYMQHNRKLAIIRGDYKYIYNKRNSSEELYDIKYDPHENVNLLINNWYDENRGKFYYLEVIYYYPRWEEAEKNYYELRSEKNRIWKEGLPHDELLYKLNTFKQRGLANIYRYFSGSRKSTVKGRWDSLALRIKYEE